MGITRCDKLQKKKSNGKRGQHRKPLKSEAGRCPTYTRIGEVKKKSVRVRGGKHKIKALRLNAGHFENEQGETIKYDILDVVFSPSSLNEKIKHKYLYKGTLVALKPSKNEGTSANDDADVYRVKDAKKAYNYVGIITTRPGQIGCISGRIITEVEREFYIVNHAVMRI